MSGKDDPTIEALKRAGTKVFEMITIVQTADSSSGKVDGINFPELLHPYKGQKIRIVIEKLNQPKTQ